MSAQDYALARGMAATRGTLERWNADPLPILGAWLRGASLFGAGLLVAVFVVASLAPADLTPAFIPGLAFPADLGDAAAVIWRNGLVLALHAVACVAGFIAGSALPMQAKRMTGLSRVVHEKARPLAFAWVLGVTCFSLVTQAYILGSTGSQLANQLAISPGLLILTVLPHAMLELTAVFLPLAAWVIASRHGAWEDLLAATVATVAVALPMLAIAAAWETWVWPLLLEGASPLVTSSFA